jgi:hypothetical protein
MFDENEQTRGAKIVGGKLIFNKYEDSIKVRKAYLSIGAIRRTIPLASSSAKNTMSSFGCDGGSSSFEEDDDDGSRREASRRDTLVAKWKEHAKQLASSQFVYVLTHEKLDYRDKYNGQEPTVVIGVFASKEAAVARATTAVKPDTPYGGDNIEDAIKKYELNYDQFTDNRENPPDDGILVQLGSEDSDCHSVERIIIKRMPLLALYEPAPGPKKKRKSIVNLT